MADNATLKSQYTAQVEEDLERNAKERDRLTSEVAALRDQLAALEEDHTLLLGVRRALADGSDAGGHLSVTPTRPATAAKLPRARKPKKAADAPRTGKRATAHTATGKDSSAKGNPAKGSPAKDSSDKTATWADLITDTMTRHAEPRSATEIADALTHAHPGRTVQTTVVRNTLEALVAKGHAVRSKQSRSVFYAAAGTPAPADAPQHAEPVTA